MSETAVLVVGAGPTGLALACGLRLHGVPVRVVDQAPGPATTSRANILYGRGVEVLDRLGALGDLPERAVRPMKLATYVNGRPALGIPLPTAGGAAGRIAMYVSQAEIEAQLRARLSELGGAVEWGTALVAAEGGGTGITAVLGTGETVHAGWLLGCDGAHSAVRKLAGIGFPGVPVIEQFLLADVHVDWDRDHSVGHVFMHPDGVLMAIPMRLLGRAGGLWRLMANVPPPMREASWTSGRLSTSSRGWWRNARASRACGSKSPPGRRCFASIAGWRTTTGVDGSCSPATRRTSTARWGDRA